MIEPVEINIENGTVRIDGVEMPAQGVEADGLNPYEIHDAGIVCYIVSESSDNKTPENTTRVWAHTGDIKDWDPSSDLDAKAWNPVINIKNNTVLGYKYFNFGDGSVSDKDVNLILSMTEHSAGTVSAGVHSSLQTMTVVPP